MNQKIVHFGRGNAHKFFKIYMVNICIWLGNYSVFFSTLHFHCRISVFSLKINHLGHGGHPRGDPKRDPGGHPKRDPPKKVAFGVPRMPWNELKGAPRRFGNAVTPIRRSWNPYFYRLKWRCPKKVKKTYEMCYAETFRSIFHAFIWTYKNRGLSPSNNFLARRRAPPDDSGKLKPLFL